ncbi:hypothetical protein HaLaN_08348 [Haematococcus lacustris]|uniref:Secreted protein n=1 Tax=Haematococcus lacustris TaxID=44745 RepID=A0A699Z0Z7_HAELA|nr:hypothetical protein HaLaN_08348 [Haematococcus lacustris]
MNRGGVLLLYIALPQLSSLALFLAEAYEEKDADEEGAYHEDEPYTEVRALIPLLVTSCFSSVDEISGCGAWWTLGGRLSWWCKSSSPDEDPSGAAEHVAPRGTNETRLGLIC